MPSASSYTNKLRFSASVKNTKAQLPGGVGNLTQGSIAGCGLDVNYSPIDYSQVCGCNKDRPRIPPPPFIPLIYTFFSGGGSIPIDVAVDSNGNVYILFYNRTIVKVDTAGNQTQLNIVYTSNSIYISGDYLYLSCNTAIVKLTLLGVMVLEISLPNNYPYALTTDSSGNIYIADPTNNQIVKLNSTGTYISTYIGLTNIYGVAVDSIGNIYANYGTNIIARVTSGSFVNSFYSSEITIGGIALDSLGNIYVSNNTSNQITKINSSGIVVSNFNAFAPTISVSVDFSGNIFALTNSNGVVLKLSSAGTVVNLFNFSGNPTALTVDSNGYVYALCSGPPSQLVILSPTLAVLYRLAIAGISNSIVLDSSKNIYILKTASNSILKLNPYVRNTTFGTTSGNTVTNIIHMVNTYNYLGVVISTGNINSLNSSGTYGPTGHIPTLTGAFGITQNAVYPNYYYATTSSNVIYSIYNSRSTPKPAIVWSGWNSYSIFYPVASSFFSTTRVSGNNQQLQITFTPPIYFTAGTKFTMNGGPPGYSVYAWTVVTWNSNNIIASATDTNENQVTFPSGTNVTAGVVRLNTPAFKGLVSTNGSNIYAVEQKNSRIFGITVDSNHTTVNTTPANIYIITGAGSGTYENICVIGSNAFLTDILTKRIIKVALSGTSATYTSNYTYDNNSSVPISITTNGTNIWAVFGSPANVVVQLTSDLGYVGTFYVNTPTAVRYYNNNIYVACTDDNNNKIISKITPSASPTTITTSASGNFLQIAADITNNIYVSTDNNKIIKLQTDGTILNELTTNITGSNGLAVLPNGSRIYESNSSIIYKITDTDITNIASLGGSMNPDSLICDSNNNLYASTGSNNQVVKITPSGTTTVIAGTGTQGYSGDTGIATAAKLNNPAGIALDRNGTNLYIAENSTNNAVRKVVLSA